MPDSLLTILKIAFLAVLWLFFLRVLRAVWAELRAPAPAPVAAPTAAPTAAPGSGAPTAASAGAAPTRTAGTAPPDLAPAQLLVLDSPEQRGQVFALTEEVTVGRGGGCGVALNDRMVSQLHARIFRSNGQLFVEDLGSTNGTLLNGQKVSASLPSAIRKGDRLQVGKTVLEVTSGKRGGGGGGAG